MLACFALFARRPSATGSGGSVSAAGGRTIRDCLNLVAWCWRLGDDRRLIVVNLSEESSQGLIRVPWDDLADRSWRLADLLTQSVYERNGMEMQDAGLYVDLGPWRAHFLAFNARP